MTADQFRELVLVMPGTTEQEHQGHPDFRVGGKVFATLGPEEDWAMVRLPPELQEIWVREQPEVFQSFAGAWGKRGCTRIVLARARKKIVREALIAAWRNTAPRRLVDDYDSGRSG